MDKKKAVPKKKAKKKNKSGKPRAIIEWGKVDLMLQAGCDGASVARRLGIHPDTLYNRCVEDKGVEYDITTFSAYRRIKVQEGDDLLRLAQFKKAVKGDNVQLVWLGKNRLGQKDKAESEHKVSQVTPEDLTTFIQSLSIKKDD